MIKRTGIWVLLALLLCGLLFAPVLTEKATQASVSRFTTTTLSGSTPAELVSKEIRVGIYYELNITHPDYAWGGAVSTNITAIQNILQSAGYQVTPLTVQDISNHKLKTADYDVFIIFDTEPRENITWLVKEYWLGGGSILSIDGGINYINYFGIMCPDFIDTNNYGADWTYYSSSNQRVETRHPVSRAYQIDDDIALSFDFAAYSRAALAGSSTADEYTFITYAATNSAWVNTVARDPKNQGGRVVQLFGDQVRLPPESLLVDAIDWLAPSPKGRILIDFTHDPYYGVDIGDPSGYNLEPRYAQLRDEWVNHTFTVDKLYPGDTSELTSGILSKYDMLFINLPNTAYSSTEISVIHNFVTAGGGLLLLGDFSTFTLELSHLRDIINGYSMNITTGQFSTPTTNASYFEFHPLTEMVSKMYFQGGSYLSYSGSAVPVIRDTSDNVLIVAEEIGNGRVVLGGDVNFLANHIQYDNLQFGLNIANWLCSGGADILVYTDGANYLGSDWNYFRAPIASALNELGVKYFMSNEYYHFNLSLASRDWNLVIIDANSQAPLISHPLIKSHLQAGGKLIWRDFMFRMSAYNSMWNYLGWQGNDTTITAGPPTVYLWDTASPVFNLPVDYGAANINSSTNYLNTDYTYVTLFANATALAGITPSESSTHAAIVLSVGGRALCNMFGLTEYLDDTDDSTYADAYEIWLNEIAFMLKPAVDHPADVEYTVGDTGNSIIWHPSSELPLSYQIRRNGSLVLSQGWSGSAINYNVDGLSTGTYVFQIKALDRAGYTVIDEVSVTVLAATTTTTTTTTGAAGLPLDPTVIIIVIAGIGVVVIIILLALRKRPAK
jgi:hypothetical protein